MRLDLLQSGSIELVLVTNLLILFLSGFDFFVEPVDFCFQVVFGVFVLIRLHLLVTDLYLIDGFAHNLVLTMQIISFSFYLPKLFDFLQDVAVRLF